jgi:acetyl esterase/lipase
MHKYNLNLDVTRIILAGDSAGANIASILSLKFIQDGKYKPKLQALVYPPTQYFNFLLPSSIQYSNLEPTSRAKLSLFHMGLKRVNKIQEEFLIKNLHTLLIQDKDLRKEYENRLRIDLIPEIYRINKNYYNNSESLNNFIYPTDEEYNIEDCDKDFRNLVKNLFNYNISPGLLDDESLKDQPTTLVLVCEHDTRKDEGLIYAERLKNAGNSVDVQFYENGFHGIFMSENSLVSKKMRLDLIDFIKKKLY